MILLASIVGGITLEHSLLQNRSLPDRQTTAYTDLIQNIFADEDTPFFTPFEAVEVGNLLHGVTIQQSCKERRVQPSTIIGIRKRIRYKLGAASLAAAVNHLCRQAFAIVPPIHEDMTPLMGRLTPAEKWEMQLVAVGYKERESALLRSVTYHTVHTQRTSLRCKRAANNMAGVVLHDYHLQVYALTNPKYEYPASRDESSLAGGVLLGHADHTYGVTYADQPGCQGNEQGGL